MRAVIGAVNTLVAGPGGWRGCNTDVAGFLAGCAGLDLSGRRVAVLGTGGAARAVALAARRARGGGDLLRPRPGERRRARRGARRRRAARARCRPGPGTCSSTPRRSARIRDSERSACPESRYDGEVVVRPRLQPAAHAVSARRGRARVPHHRRPRHAGGAGEAPDSNCGRASGRTRSRCARRRTGRCRARRSAHETDDVRGVRGPGPPRHVRAGVQGDHGRSADARVGVPEDRRALRLRLSARKRGRRRAGGALLVSRQGPVPDPARARTARRVLERDGERVASERRRSSTRCGRRWPGSSRRSCRACRASPAVPSGTSGTTRCPGSSRCRCRRARTARRPPTRPGSWCSTPCWPSITSSTASC